MVEGQGEPQSDFIKTDALGFIPAAAVLFFLR